MRNGVELGVGALQLPKQKELVRYVRQTGIVPKDPVFNAVVQRATTEIPDYFRTEGGANLIEEGDKKIYAALKEFYVLDEDDPMKFYHAQLRSVKGQVESLVRKLCPDDTATFNLSPTVSFPPSPTEVIKTLHTPSIGAREKYEFGRQISLALISAEIDRKSQGAEQQIADVQGLFNDTIFFGGSVKSRIYALHDNDTNRAVWVETTNTLETPDIANTHLKEHRHQVFRVNDFGNVYFNSRVKETPVIKAVKKALDRSRKTNEEDEAIQPIKDVPDIMGMKFVLENAFYSTDPLVTKFKDTVKDVLKKGFGLTDEAFVPKNLTRGASEQSGKFDGQRLMVTFPGVGIPLELMFHGIGGHINNDFHIGAINPETGKPDGAAHRAMEIDRDVTVLDALFPSEIYGPRIWDMVRKKNYGRAVEDLRGYSIVPKDIVDVELIEEDGVRHVKLVNKIAQWTEAPIPNAQ